MSSPPPPQPLQELCDDVARELIQRLYPLIVNEQQQQQSIAYDQLQMAYEEKCNEAQMLKNQIERLSVIMREMQRVFETTQEVLARYSFFANDDDDCDSQATQSVALSRH